MTATTTTTTTQCEGENSTCTSPAEMGLRVESGPMAAALGGRTFRFCQPCCNAAYNVIDPNRRRPGQVRLFGSLEDIR